MFVIAQGIMQLPTMYMVFMQSGGSQSLSGVEAGAVIAAITAPMAIGLILWFSARTIASWIIGAARSEPSADPATATQLQAVAISTAGLVIVFLSLPGFISLIIQTIGGSYVSEGGREFDINTISYLAASGLKVLFGVLLVVGVRFWVVVLHKFQNFGLEVKPSNQSLNKDAQ
jgi:hypothetical protein